MVCPIVGISAGLKGGRIATAMAQPVTQGEPSTTPLSLQAQGVSKRFEGRGGAVQALRQVNLSAREGEFVSIIGPSGCGKSTLFNIFSGVLKPDEGHVYIHDQAVGGRVGFTGYMPQKDLLLPWRTVQDNVILGSEVAGVPKQDAVEEALPLLREFGLGGFESAYPHTLSGGMRQRVAFLRTVLYGKDILLLDEPFGALDAMTRSAMQEWLLGVWRRMRQTIIFVTHDVEEAVLLSDHVYVMTARPGQIRKKIAVDLPRPRTYEMLVDRRFLDHKLELLQALHEESEAALVGPP